MDPTPAPTRPTPLAGSAATIVALLSMATMVAAMPTGRAVTTEMRPASTEATSVREIAVAVVAAAARDLLGRDRLDTALAAPMAWAIEAPASGEVVPEAAHPEVPGVRALDARLLDLPPPLG